ncbi:ABC transporter substrate-binding protein [Amycolatopsis pittospori]|uniref:ABC transporter substrate-binding protein n=1 Tax=Amycolatopsis pittospori TaxID=2749434 RepID=UPI001A9EAC3D|nr:sugar ABC transporter substrate-binding protein [Amycolatopsis pittospori]
MPAPISRRDFLVGSMLFAGGAVVSACATGDPLNKGGNSSGAKVTLNQWYHAYGEDGTQEAVKRYAREFTKANPDIAVNITWIAGDYETKLNSALLTSQAPDLFELGDFRYQNVKNGLLAPLDDIVAPVRGEFSQAALDMVTVDGKLYGVKMMDDVMMLFYRKSVLQAAGIAPPQTFAELLEATKKLNADKQNGLYLGTDGVGDSAYLLLWSAGVDLFDASGEKVAFDGPRAVAAIEGLKQLHDSGGLLKGYTTDWSDPGAFKDKAVAMQWCGLWAMPQIKKSLGDDFGVVPWPKFGDAGRPAARVGGWSQLVNAKGSHVDAAKEYVNWLWIQQQELQKDWCVKYGFHIPARKPIAAQTTEFAEGAAKDAVAISQQNGHTFPALWNKASQNLLLQSVVKIANGEAAAGPELADAAKKVQAEVDKQLA